MRWGHGEVSALILSVETYHRERMLEDVFVHEENNGPSPGPISADEVERIFKTMETNQVYVVADSD
jgi:hypothetical protein